MIQAKTTCGTITAAGAIATILPVFIEGMA